MFLSTLTFCLSSPRNRNKDEAALNDLIFNLDNKLKTIMKNAGFGFDERRVYCKPFLYFMQFTLLHLVRDMHDTKQRLSYRASENEKKCFQRLESNITVVHDIKINKAI